MMEHTRRQTRSAGQFFRGKSGSGTFLMEMILAVFFFIICVSICMLAFAKSDHMSRTARKRNQAVLAAESTAEIWKVSGTNGLEEQMHFTAAADASELSAEYEDFRIYVKLEPSGNGETDAVIRVCPVQPSLADPEEYFRLETRRYERGDR